MPSKVALPEQMLVRAEFVPSTFDEKARTVEVVFATETPVRRSSWMDGEYDEVLGLGAEECDLSCLRAGAPVFYSHGMTYGTSSSELQRSHIGVIENPRIEVSNGVPRGVARMRFSERAELNDILADVRSGVLTGVSSGYRVQEMRDMTPKAPPTPPGAARANDAAPVPVYRAVKWKPIEVSLTPMPADQNSRVRSMGLRETLVQVPLLRSNDDGDAGQRAGDSGEGSTMSEKVKAAAEGSADAATATLTAPDPEQLKRAADDATKAELDRGAWIRSEVKRQHLDEAIADDLVGTRATRETARDRILDELAKRGAATTVHSQVRVGEEGRDKVRAQVEQALLVRAGVLKSSEATGNHLVGAPLLRMAEECVRASGIPINSYAAGNIATLALRATGSMGTTDFPKISANVASKSMRKAYEIATPTYRMIAQRSSASDFKPMSLLNLGAGGLPQLLNEHGEVRQTVITETGETFQVKTWAKLLVMTRQLLINDDAGALTNLPARIGANIALMEDIQAWSLISSNPLLADGVALFAAAHGNELSPDDDLQIGSLSGLRKLLRLQTDPDGNILGLNGRFLIVPAALETLAQQLTTTIQPALFSSVNPFASLQVIVVPHLDASSLVRHFMAADPALIPTLGYAYLNGAEGPTIEEFVEANFDGFKLRLLHDWGVGILDHRGIVRSNGTT